MEKDAMDERGAIKNVKAGLEIWGKLIKVAELTWRAYDLALGKGKPHIAERIRKDKMEHGEPFFEASSDKQVAEWFQNPKQGKIELNTRIKQLREQLKRIKDDVEE